MNENNNEDFWLKSKSAIEDNKKRLVEEYNKLRADIIKISGKTVDPKMIFLKDRFGIFAEVIQQEFIIARDDLPVSLSDLRNLIDNTDCIFDQFDNKISIKENVKKFYDNN